MANLSQLRRQRMLAFLEKMREQHKDDDEVLVAINEVENEINEKKYGLVWEEHSEEVEDRMVDEVPIFVEDKDKEITMTDNGYNFLLEGDNLHSLHLLEKTHREKIDVIYIDPPYNTRNKEFIYDDCRIGKDDTFRHSKWLSFMAKRLVIAKRLLAESGTIFISIDDNEESQLKILCDTIFGEDNFVANIAIVGTANESNDGVLIQNNKESLLVYAKNYPHARINRIDSVKASARSLADAPSGLSTRLSMGYTIYYNEKTGDMQPVFDYDESKVATNDESQIYTDNQDLINAGYTPVRPGFRNGVIWRWRWGIDTFWARKDDITIRKNKTGRFVAEFIQSGKNPPRNVQSFTTGTVELRDLLGANKFPSPKSLDMMRWILQISTKKDSEVLDFFAGTGTMGQAVLRLNAEDGGNRHFILCTNNTETDGKVCENMTYPRIKTAITGVRSDGSSYSGGIPADLKYYHTDFILKKSEHLADDLIAHVDEMIQLEYGVKIDKEKYISILTDEDADNLEKNWANFPNIRAIYISRHVLLTGKQKELFDTKDCFVIPDYYFREELRDAGEA